VVETVVPPPGDKILGEGVSNAIVEFGHGADEVPRTVVEPVRGERVGHRSTAKAVQETRVDSGLDSSKNIHRLVDDRAGEVVFIFLHGGQF
jgi:hypothetical protein